MKMSVPLSGILLLLGGVLIGACNLFASSNTSADARTATAIIEQLSANEVTASLEEPLPEATPLPEEGLTDPSELTEPIFPTDTPIPVEPPLLPMPTARPMPLLPAEPIIPASPAGQEDPALNRPETYVAARRMAVVHCPSF